jgi:HD-like signal output (HDOD) protein
MLHDMGRIVLLNCDPVFISKIYAFCGDHAIPGEVFENISAGMNHGEIGARVAEKWNFPERLVECIRWHHEPQKAKKETQPMVYTIYMADKLVKFAAHEIQQDEIDPKALTMFSLTKPDYIKTIVTRLETALRHMKD